MSPITFPQLSCLEGPASKIRERGGLGPLSMRKLDDHGSRTDRHGLASRPAGRVRVVALTRTRRPQPVGLRAVTPEEPVPARKRAVAPRVEMSDLGRSARPSDPQDDQLASAGHVSAPE